ncbi:uncharacterized protein LOC134802175 [Cydia splendana]|uniref:uncharacterized protein LOC134802175 n=1 Tax=Cydia splendana TaxID=1100963 RepID=UPI00300DB06E
MERYTISKSEKQTIYEIYRACRLCGAGGGYRMPIIQNIIDLDSSELELRQKIQECLQLEVRPDDRMPPLICELCVDKVNDFYQFLDMTRQTNIKTRTRLGLPIQDTKKGEPEQSNCILGVTEPVYTKDDEPPKKSKAGPKCTKKIKKEPDVNVKIENVSDSSSRSSSVSSRVSRRAPSPSPAPSPAARPRRAPALPPSPAAALTPSPAAALTPSPAAAPARPRRSLLEEALARRKPDPPKIKDAKKTETKKTEAPKDPQIPKEKKATPAKKKGELESLLEDSMKFDDNTLLMPRSLKRTREEPPRPALLPKRANIARYLMDARIRPIPTKELLKEPSPPRRPGPRSRQPVNEPPPNPRPGPKSKKTRVEEENMPVPLKVPKPKAKPELPKTKEPPKPPEEPPLPSAPPYKCIVCETQCKNSGAFARHLSIHVPIFTKPAHACNPCGTWYVTAEEAASHHGYHSASTFPYHCRRCFDDFRTLQLYDEGGESPPLPHRLHLPLPLPPVLRRLPHSSALLIGTYGLNLWGKWFVTVEEAASHHRYLSASTFPYHCRRCFDDFRTLQLYDDHIESGLCVGDEPPSVKCEECLALFAAAALRAAHRCPGRGQAARPGGKCSKCSRTYATSKTLKKHESQCSQKRKGGDLIADPDVLRRLKPMQVRITKCDGLLARETGDHYDVSRVKPVRITKCDRLLARETGDHYDVSRVKPVRITKCDGLLARETGDHYDVSRVKPVRITKCDGLLARETGDHYDVSRVKPVRITKCDGLLARETGDHYDVSRVKPVRITKCDGLLAREAGDHYDVSRVKPVRITKCDGLLARETGDHYDVIYSWSNPDVLRRLKPMQVRITKCDGLLARETGDHYDVSRVKPNYGLAKNYIYPYMKLPPVKSEPLFRDSMVAIPVALKEEFSFTHWDSDSDVEESIIRSVPSLTTLAIKKLFSKNLLGKVPRKKKKVKNEAFDHENDFGDVSKDINDIINSLDDMGNGSLDRKDLTARIKDIIGCFDSDMSESVEEDKTANEQSENKYVDANVNDKTIDNDGEKNKTTSDESHCETVDGKGTDETMADDDQGVHDTVTNDVSTKMDMNNENDKSTKENVIESNDNGNCEKTSNDEVYHGEKTIDKVLESNQLNDECNDNERINRLDSETNDHTVSYDKEIDISLQESKDESVAVNTRDLENGINGVNTLQNENSFVNEPKINQNQNSSEKESKSNDETKLTEEVSKQINKESPIKHSIENLIGETDKNPEKFINEVISSIEELNRCHEQINGQNVNEINNSNLMDALDEHIGEKRLSDQDKITLEDLLPKGDTCDELENISDDDFNFDA